MGLMPTIQDKVKKSMYQIMCQKKYNKAMQLTSKSFVRFTHYIFSRN
jgi:hypothetical protein